MTTRSQFCPVAKAAEVFGDRWTPIIIRRCALAPGNSESCSRPHPLYRGQCWLSVSSNLSSFASCILSRNPAARAISTG
jgi:hypothetical protein